MLRNSSSVGVDCDQGRFAWNWWYLALSIRFGLSRSPHWVIIWLVELLGRREPGLLGWSGVNSCLEISGCVLAEGLVVCVVIFSTRTLGACPRAGLRMPWTLFGALPAGWCVPCLLAGALLLGISWVVCPS